MHFWLFFFLVLGRGVTIAEAVEGYSGAELKIVAKDVAMVPLRKLIEAGASIAEMERSEGM